LALDYTDLGGQVLGLGMAELRWRTKKLANIDAFLTAAQCDEYVAFGESKVFEEAP